MVIPGDIALKATEAKPPAWLIPKAPAVRPDDSEVAALAGLLDAGKRVTLLCGRAARRA